MKRNTTALLLVLLLTTLGWSRDRTIVRFGDDVRVNRDQSLEAVISIGGDVQIFGEITESAVSFGGDVYLGPSARVQGDVVSIGGHIYPEPGAEIDGDLVEMSPFHWRHHFGFSPFYPGPLHYLAFLPLIGFLAVGILLALLFPETFVTLGNRLEVEPGKALLYGLGQSLFFVPVLIFLVITIVGIALIPIVVVAVVLAGFLGYFISASLVGRRLLQGLHQSQSSLLIQVVLGLLLLAVLGWVPFLGGLIKALAFLLGFGVVGMAVLDYRERKRREKSVSLPVEETPDDTPAGEE
ncbi:MAG: hypothetical protein D6762_00005 [Candidatus Neomarinimicrobiota bacterium]|nr:MAG: hypothetical protein D6762_00005 [Candidatus Neomarinimicrobiota bacterium]